jgi:hypothetical protein
MSQHDQNVANADGATVRTDINNAIGALFSNSSGATTPSTTVPHQFWADTTANLLKRRNAANSGWLVLNTLDEAFVVDRGSNTILVQKDFGKFFRLTSTFSQTFTAAATLGDGWYVDIKNDGAGVITLDPNGGELIDGATTLALAAGSTTRVYCNGSAFTTFAKVVPTDLAAYATLASPALTGTPTAPTAAASTNTTQIATCAMVQAAIAAASDSVKAIRTQLLTSSGTYTPDPDLLYAYVILQGPGGGGLDQVPGAGAGAGARAEKLLDAATIGASKTVTLGAAGIKGAATGTDGGTSTFGSILSVPGGQGTSDDLYGDAAPTAVPTGGDINIPGNPGHNRYKVSSDTSTMWRPGVGGSSAYGSGGTTTGTSSSSTDHPPVGYGGGGAQRTNGGPGMCYIIEYCSA